MALSTRRIMMISIDHVISPHFPPHERRTNGHRGTQHSARNHPGSRIMSWRCTRRVYIPRGCDAHLSVSNHHHNLNISARAASSYAQTLPNLALNQSTRVIYQGFTGRVSTANAAESIAYGTNIVGGCSRREGEHLGLPLFSSVRKAVEELKPDATAVFVGAKDGQASSAIEEAIEAEIGLVVAVAEFVPLGDMLRVSLPRCMPMAMREEKY